MTLIVFNVRLLNLFILESKKYKEIDISVGSVFTILSFIWSILAF